MTWETIGLRLYSPSDMIIDNETYRRDARKRCCIVAG